MSITISTTSGSQTGKSWILTEASPAELAAIAAAAAGDTAKLIAAIGDGVDCSNTIDEVRGLSQLWLGLVVSEQLHSHTLTLPQQFGHSAVYRAVQRQSAECVEALIKADCDVNVTGCSRAPLLQAVELRSLRLTEMLLDHGANPDCTDPKECTPLMVAAQSGCTEIMKRLLSAGASPFKRDASQLNALGHAITGGKMGAVKALLSRGTMVLNSDSQAEYALGLAEATALRKRDLASQEIFELLQKRAETPTAAATAAAAGQSHEQTPAEDGKYGSDRIEAFDGQRGQAAPVADQAVPHLNTAAGHK